jgi:hypothetical protein
LDKKKNITATVCLYAGRPNPYWIISPAAYSKLLLIIKKLPAANPQVQPSLLGYAGVVITKSDATIYAFNGVITLKEETIQSGYKDANRQIEKKILQHMPEVLKEELKKILPDALR